MDSFSPIWVEISKSDCFSFAQNPFKMEDPINEQVHIQTNESTSVANESDENFTSTGTIPAPPFSISAGETNKVKDGSENETEGKDKGKPVEMPFDLGTVKTAKEAIDALKELWNNSNKIIDVVKNSEDIPADLGSLELDKEATLSIWQKILSKYQGDKEVEMDEEDKLDLQALSETYVTSYEPAFGELKKKGSETYDKLSGFNKLDGNTPEMKAFMQKAYQNNDSGMLKSIEEFLGSIEYYNEKGKQFSATASKFSSTIKDSKLLTHLEGMTGKVTGFLEQGNSMLDGAKKLNEAYEAMGGDSQSVEGPVAGLKLTMDMVDGVINLLDLPGLNLIQVAWNNFYKPMIDICITGLYKITEFVNDSTKDLVQTVIKDWNSHKGDEPPRLSKINNYIASIGIPLEVFDYMWYAMKGIKANLNQTIIDYFEDNYDRIDAGTSTELPYERVNVISWQLDVKRFKYWSHQEKYVLWSMFFGTTLPHPPGTKPSSIESFF